MGVLSSVVQLHCEVRVRIVAPVSYRIDRDRRFGLPILTKNSTFRSGHWMVFGSSHDFGFLYLFGLGFEEDLG